MSDEPKNAFEEAGRESEPTLLRQFFEMLREHRKLWLIPIVVFLVALGAIVVLGSTAAGPFIYTLF